MIDDVFDKCGPFQGFPAFIQRLPGDRFSYFKDEAFSFLFVSFFGEPYHFDIHFQSDLFPEIREVIKKIGILSADKNRNDIPLVFYGFYNKIFLPGQVLDPAVFFPAA